MSEAITKDINISGFNSADSVTKLDISLSESSGTISYTSIKDKEVDVNDHISIQGVKANVLRSGKINSISDSVTAEVGSDKVNNSIAILMLEDEAKYLPYKITDIVSILRQKSGLSIVYKGYEVCIESFTFSGTVKDCINNIAGLVFGSVSYSSLTDTYTIMAGDYIPTSSSEYIHIESKHIKSIEVYAEKDSSMSQFGMMLLELAKEIARLRQSIIDATTTVDETSTRTLSDTINFKFGGAGGHNFIPNDIEVESTEWDIWYEDELGNKWINPTKAAEEKNDPKFVSKQKFYFKVETLEETITTVDNSSAGYTVKRGKKRGLRSMSVGTSLYVRLKNITSTNSVVGKGFLTNLQTLGMPSLTKYLENKAQGSSADEEYEDGYHILYEIETREKKVKDNSTNIVENLYIPYLRITCPPSIYNAIYAALLIKLSRTPNSFEINDAMTKQLYSVNMELMSTEIDYGKLLYVGYQDKYGRVITNNNQVVLVSGNDNISYYAPLEGMDINFSISQPSTSSYNPSIFNDYFTPSKIMSQLELAFKDLKTLAIAQDIVCKSKTTEFPKFLYEVLDPPINGNTLGRIVGVVISEKEPTEDLTINAFITTERQKKRLERKLKVLECKINLIIKCMNKYSNIVSLSEVKNHLREIIDYEAILYEVKNESISTMQLLKASLDEHINFFLDNLGSSVGSIKHKAKLKTFIPDIIPPIGTVLKCEHVTFIIKSVSSSGLEIDFEGELQ